MSGRKLWVALLMGSTVFIASAAAQKNEIAGGIGRTFIANQAIAPGPVPLMNNFVRFGNGLSFEVNYARHLMGEGFYSLDVEVPVVINPDEDLGSGNGAVPKQYSAYFVTPSIRGKLFADTHFQPWVSVGGGFGRFSISKTQVFGGTNPGQTSKNSGLMQAGLGLDVRTFSRITLRLAARDFWSSALPLNVDTGKTHQHNIVVTGGIAFRF
ncbi:MAG TPA: hypothetical protein VGF08_08545 [Terriglobales bacterium]|jgi:hypothetical protein